jgi:hypothetical protein
VKKRRVARRPAPWLVAPSALSSATAPKSAARGAGVGAVTGGARGIAEGERDKVQVVKRCLRGRGYKVLN